MRLALARAEADNPDGSISPMLLGAHQQLLALIEFVEGDPGCASVAELHALRQALVELAHGRPVEWLKPPHNAKGSRLPQETAVQHGGYAAIMHALMTHGKMPEKEAAAFVVQHGGLRRTLLKGRRNAAQDWKVVRNWHDRAINARPPSDERDAFRYMEDRIAIFLDAGVDIRSTAIILLRTALKPVGDGGI
jgi:hypothetical protein